jgi:hypothetical protein
MDRSPQTEFTGENISLKSRRLEERRRENLSPRAKRLLDEQAGQTRKEIRQRVFGDQDREGSEG